MMARYLKQYEKEHMKMAILKQEETFKQQVQELHQLYRVQKQLMTNLTNTMPSIKCNPDEERFSVLENEAGSSKSSDSYSEQKKPPLVLEESDLELTLAIGRFGAIEKKRTTKKEASCSLGSRTSISSSSMESGSPDCRVFHPSQLGSKTELSPNVGQHMNQEGLKQPRWLHHCWNLA